MAFPTHPASHAPGRKALWPATAITLQAITLTWTGAECGIAGYAAITAHSPALAAFASDSFVELVSALVVLAQWIPGVHLAERTAARLAASLLALLAFVVTALAVATLVLHRRPDTSRTGLAITAAALVVMPGLAYLKRREAARQGNAALGADAAQSATCAWLAFITLVGLAASATLHLGWVDAAAALIAVPLLLHEAREAWHGAVCHCC